MSYSAKAVANHFLDLAEVDNDAISPMKMQKLVYFAHGWNLALRSQPLINEQIEAWKFGPVVRTLYQAFREYGNQPIKEKAKRYRLASGPGMPFEVVTPSIERESEDSEEAALTEQLLNRVWEVYRGYSAIQLSNMTHAEGSPWRQVFEQYHGDIPKGTDIPTDLIAADFRKTA